MDVDSKTSSFSPLWNSCVDIKRVRQRNIVCLPFYVGSVNNVFLFNPLTANDELSRHENLTFLWTWILRWIPRSFATHASLCNALSSNKLCPKTVKILAIKGLNEMVFILMFKRDISDASNWNEFWFFFLIFFLVGAPKQNL